jgi:hypothetical protein
MRRATRWCAIAVSAIVLLASCVLENTGAAPALRCPGGLVEATQVPPLLTSRFYKLRAEPKTGTTWLQKVTFGLLLELCDLYGLIEGLRCEAMCTLPNPHVDPTCTKTECPLHNVTFCRRVLVQLNDTRGPDDAARTTVIEVTVQDKHVVPFIIHSDHPNKTPVKRGLPQWLADCVEQHNTSCIPPASSLDSDLGLDNNQTQELLRQAGLLSAHGPHGDSAPQPIDKPPGLITVARDPRAVSVSASQYQPGMNMFGKLFKKQQNVDDFVLSVINMTTGWTQFRHFLFSRLSQSGALPVFSTFYEVRGVALRISRQHLRHNDSFGADRKRLAHTLRIIICSPHRTSCATQRRKFSVWRGSSGFATPT